MKAARGTENLSGSVNKLPSCIGPVPPEPSNHSAPIDGLRQQTKLPSSQTPFLKTERRACLHDTRGPHSHAPIPIRPSSAHHVLETGTAALRPDGSSPAGFPRPGPHLCRARRLERQGPAAHRPLRPRRHLCHCSGTPCPDSLDRSLPLMRLWSCGGQPNGFSTTNQLALSN